jgi:hypothetical protein
MANNDLKNLLSELLSGGLSHENILTQLTDVGVVGSAPATAGGGTAQGAAGDVTAQVASLNNQLLALSAAQNAAITALTDNTNALTQGTTSKTGGGSVLSSVESTASSLLGGGILGSPILEGILSLFGGGGGSSQSAALTPFALPPAVSYEGALTAGGQVAPADTGQNGQPRSLAQTSNTTVTVQVNAMDSQSFLDHSDDIAQAVRSAILNSSSLNDVLTSL